MVDENNRARTRPGNAQGSRREVAERDEELERARDLLAVRRTELADAARSRSEWIEGVALELGTPAESVTKLAELTLRTQKGLNDRGRANLERVIRIGRELVALAADLSDFASLDRGPVAVETERFEPIALARECVAELDGFVPSDRIRITPIDGGEDPGRHQSVAARGLAPRGAERDTIRQDRTKVKKIVSCLLRQALAASAGPIQVATGRSTHADRPGEAALEIAVTLACGTSATDAWSHEDPAGVSRARLELVRRLTERLGGRAHEETRSGVGSTLRVTVPDLSADGIARVASPARG